VTPDDAPFLLQHGTADVLISSQQSQEMYNALQAAPTSYSFLQLVQGGDHGFVTSRSNPTPAQLGQQVANFFITNLKNNPTPLPQ
jgi:acetyl esterase/lipase